MVLDIPVGEASPTLDSLVMPFAQTPEGFRLSSTALVVTSPNASFIDITDLMALLYAPILKSHGKITVLDARPIL